MDFKVRLYHLRRLFNDSERKLFDFNEIIPFQFNPKKIYSPKLVNLMLEIGPQIEDIANLIISELSLSKKGGITSRIREINKNGVLSSFEIFCFLPNKLLLQPFSQKQELWDIYNKTKHNLSKSQFDIKYNSVVDSLGALAALHRLADVIIKIDENRKYVLDNDKWKTYDGVISGWVTTGPDGYYDSGPKIWKSLIFEIPQYFIYEHQWPKGFGKEP